jgi:hypothetical protein
MDEFLKKYGRIVKIMKVSMHNSAILALGIFRLMLFPNLSRIIGLEVITAFITY